MKASDAFFLGEITKTFSFKGEVLVYVSEQNLEPYKKLESVFIEQNDRLVPFFLQQVKLKLPHHLRLLFEDINDEEEARSLVGKSVYLHPDYMPEMSSEDLFYQQIIGYKVLEEDKTPIGTITGINTQSVQHLFEINSPLKNELLLIPIVDEWIIKVNHRKKTLRLSLPEGLLNL